ncbi:beta-ketoacyl synthase [Astrocystis sublimbata]|nr:beta-ketoacyl synthase [Astrocystis sublimbata]
MVNIGCRMPGNIRSPSDLWRVLMSKGIANMGKVPLSRFNVDAYLHPNNERPGSFNVPGGYFLEGDPHDFDPSIFGISTAEALCMDPQQRLLLEVVYEAFESSGAPLSTISGQNIGCFVGSFTQDSIYVAATEPDFGHAYTASGVDPGILANRINYIFNLKGPSLAVNTACSSSMYALDLACKAMHSGDCDGAIVGGSNLIITANQHMNTANMGVLSPTNQCHTFDASADGYGRSEAVGALYLKPLSTALRDGDPVRAVIRSTAVGR